MRWQRGRRSTNVDDRRGARVGRGVAGGGLGVLVIAVIALFLGIDPSFLFQATGPAVPTSGGSFTPSPEEERLAEFTSVVLADTEDTWNPLFRQMGRPYREPTLVLFSGAVRSACGMAGSAVGPFYCPGDQQVYIDLSFFSELQSRYGAPGDFAQAYVIAHEIGHHVQNLLGISGRVQNARRQGSEAEGNALSVLLELQADCLAGIWAHHADRARSILEAGDVEEALGAAAAIGDDRLQRQARGDVQPESFTHGTSEQRMRWFRRGIESGDLERCDTFQEGAG